jgi:hypothetical protein
LTLLVTTIKLRRLRRLIPPPIHSFHLRHHHQHPPSTRLVATIKLRRLRRLIPHSIPSFRRHHHRHRISIRLQEMLLPHRPQTHSTRKGRARQTPVRFHLKMFSARLRTQRLRLRHSIPLTLSQTHSRKVKKNDEYSATNEWQPGRDSNPD